MFEWLKSWNEDRRIRKLIRGAPLRTLGELGEDTFARIVGVVRPHGARVLEAPLSGRLCAYYAITVHARRARSRGFAPVFQISEEQEAIPFELDVEGVRALVDPADAWISSGFDHTLAGVTDPRARDLCTRLALDHVSYDHGSMRFREAVLAIDERIAIFGTGVREVAPDAAEQGYRDGASTRFRFTGTERFPLVIRDDLRSL
jgi:hypothetical protein